MSKRLDTAKIGDALHRAARKAMSASLDAQAGRFIDPAAKKASATPLRSGNRVRRDTGASSAVAEIAYDARTQHMKVTFTTGRIYLYEAVPAATYEAFAAAPSRGAHFNTHIRDRYAYREL